MEQRLTSFARAFASFEEICGEAPSPIVRDATIKRFEYTLETACKAARAFLLEAEGIECRSPKSSWRSLFETGVIEEALYLQLLAMADDRNLTAHTYVEALAERIYGLRDDYRRHFAALLSSLRSRLS